MDEPPPPCKPTLLDWVVAIAIVLMILLAVFLFCITAAAMS